MRIFLPFLLAAASFSAEPEAAALPRHVLTNDGLIVLARAGLGDALLSDLIRHKQTRLDTSADALALLARNGLSENVLRAVVEKQEQVQLRKPRLTLRPVAPVAGETAEPVTVDGGEVLLVPPAGRGRREKNEPSRWYKISMR